MAGKQGWAKSCCKILVLSNIVIDDIILRQNAHNTLDYWWRGDRVMKPIIIYGDYYSGGHEEGQI